MQHGYGKFFGGRGQGARGKGQGARQNATGGNPMYRWSDMSGRKVSTKVGYDWWEPDLSVVRHFGDAVL